MCRKLCQVHPLGHFKSHHLLIAVSSTEHQMIYQQVSSISKFVRPGVCMLVAPWSLHVLFACLTCPAHFLCFRFGMVLKSHLVICIWSADFNWPNKYIDFCHGFFTIVRTCGDTMWRHHSLKMYSSVLFLFKNTFPQFIPFYIRITSNESQAFKYCIKQNLHAIKGDLCKLSSLS